jgi:type III secretory pathway component EscT
VSGLLDAIVALLESRSIDLSAWALGVARVMPLVVLLPAFGARLLPQTARLVLGLALGLVIAPAVGPVPVGPSWPLAMVREVLFGLPVALGASALLWAALMAGGLADELRGGGQTSQLAMFESQGTALSALFGLFAAAGFIAVGGVSRVLEYLLESREALEGWPLRAARDLVASIDIALSLAAPLLALVILIEVAGALLARAAAPAHIRVLVAPLRALAVLVGLGLSLDAMFRALLGLFG